MMSPPVFSPLVSNELNILLYGQAIIPEMIRSGRRVARSRMTACVMSERYLKEDTRNANQPGPLRRRLYHGRLFCRPVTNVLTASLY